MNLCLYDLKTYEWDLSIFGGQPIEQWNRSSAWQKRSSLCVRFRKYQQGFSGILWTLCVYVRCLMLALKVQSNLKCHRIWRCIFRNFCQEIIVHRWSSRKYTDTQVCTGWMVEASKFGNWLMFVEAYYWCQAIAWTNVKLDLLSVRPQ